MNHISHPCAFTKANELCPEESYHSKKQIFYWQLLCIEEVSWWGTCNCDNGREIPPELIMNWDQTGIKLVPSSSWTMEQRGSQKVEMVGVNNKRQITAIFVEPCWVTFYSCNLSFREKHPAATRSSSFLLDGTSSTLPNTGLLRRPWCNTSTISSFLMWIMFKCW